MLHKYNLLNIYILKQRTNSKETIKEEMKHKIDTMSTSLGLKKGAANLPLHTCILIDMTALLGRVHWCWISTDHNVRAVHRAMNILTGVYTCILQCNRATFNQHAACSICCKAAVEDRVHFVLECSRLDPVRQN